MGLFEIIWLKLDISMVTCVKVLIRKYPQYDESARDESAAVLIRKACVLPLNYKTPIP